MGKGEREREKRRTEREAEEAERKAREAAAAARAAFFARWDPEDDDEGPALPCPGCGGFDRRWASEDEAREAIAAFDARWGLLAGDDDTRRVAVCPTCGDRSVVPG